MIMFLCKFNNLFRQNNINKGMPEGILRNRYNDFLRTKGKKKITQKRFSKASLNKTYEDDQVIRSSLLSTKASEVEMTTLEDQTWIEDYKDCCFLLKEVEICRQQIKKENSKKLMSVKEEVHQRRIRLMAEEATDKLKKCQKKLKNIQLTNNMNPDPHQRKIFTNIIISLAQRIRTSTRQLRNDRQKQLSQQHQIKQYNRSHFDEEIKFLSECTEEDWLEEQGLEQLENKLMQERNEEVMKIVKSIHSLNSIYKELQDLVIHQGSLLDRIDENIDMTFENVKKANQNLEEAQKNQQNSFAKKVIYVLLFLIFIFFFIFMLKHK